MFRCADDYSGSIDMASALHPQTILATKYAGEPITDPFGFPLRLRTAVKLGFKFAGVYPVAARFVRPHATYTTLLMSTGLTFGTISSLYGLNAGIINQSQFSVLVTVVILSAVVPTFLAQRFFSPPLHPVTADELVAIEDEEFEPLPSTRPD